MESCRICMKQTDDMSEIFTADTKSLVDKILFCTGVHLMEVKGLPSLICSQCIKDLTTSYNFKKTCVLSNNTYYKMLYDNQIKKEEIKTEESPNDHCYVADGYMEVKVEGLENPKVDLQKRIRITKPIAVKDVNSNMKRKIGKHKKIKKTKPAPPIPVQTVQCEKCNLDFKNKTELAKHNRTNHKTIWMCEVCAKVCKGRAALASHAFSHAPRSFQCAHCEYATAYKSDLRTHLRRHTGEKNFKCQFCPRAFATSSNLRLHERRWHIKDHRYQCKFCPKSFADISSLNRHNLRHTGAVKKFQCDHCGSQLMHRNHWRRHLLVQHNIQLPKMRVGRKKNDYLPNFITEMDIS